MNVETLDVASYRDFDGHEAVFECRDERTGLHALVAIHNASRGPALGGCRMLEYADREEAIGDVLRLAVGMTYKSALAGLPLGGGKAVILGSPAARKSRELLLAMGDFVASLEGRYIVAEDSGTTVDDMRVLRERTEYVAGLSESSPHGGDPSPATAYGTFLGIREAVRARLSRSGLDGVRVAIQGVGNVGFALAERLVRAGAEVFASDVSPERLERAVTELGITPVPAEAIHSVAVDVFSPCALGGAIDDATLPGLRATVVAGAANNQLDRPEHGLELHRRGILYAPDFAINAGGIIDIACEYEGADEGEKRARVERIATTLDEIFRRAIAEDRSTCVVANELAEQRFSRTGAFGDATTAPVGA